MFFLTFNYTLSLHRLHMISDPGHIYMVHSSRSHLLCTDKHWSDGSHCLIVTDRTPLCTSHTVGILWMGLTGPYGLRVAILKHMIHYIISPDKNMLWLYNTFILNISLSLVFMKLHNCSERGQNLGSLKMIPLEQEKDKSLVVFVRQNEVHLYWL